MKSGEAEALLNDIDIAIKNICSFNNASELEKSYLAKFLVVFICGIYEEAIEKIINEKVAQLKSPEISRFIERSLDNNFQNPKIGRIENLLEDFSGYWAQQIRSMPEIEKSALGSIVANKNALAHGSGVTITLQAVIQFYKDSRKIIEKIDALLL